MNHDNAVQWVNNQIRAQGEGLSAAVGLRIRARVAVMLDSTTTPVWWPPGLTHLALGLDPRGEKKS